MHRKMAGAKIAETDRPGTLTARIRARYPELSRAERQLADAILDFPGELASYSATELAVMADVSKATVTRLVRRLGFDGFEAARLAARAAGDGGSPLYLMRKDGTGVSARVDAAGHLDRCIANIAQSARALDPAALADAVGALAGARAIWLFGVRINYPLAAYARWQFIQVRGGVQLLPAAGETLGESLAGFGPEDVLLVVGIRRRPPLVGKVMAAARRAGTRTLLIADAHSGADGLDADWRFGCMTRSLSPLDNHTAPLALIHVLTALLVERLGAAGRAHLARIEALHEDLNEL